MILRKTLPIKFGILKEWNFVRYFYIIILYNNFVNNKHASMINYVLQLYGNFGVLVINKLWIFICKII